MRTTKGPKRVNVHRPYISAVELGKVSMGIEIAHALAYALGLKLSELVRKAEQTVRKSLFFAHNAGYTCER